MQNKRKIWEAGLLAAALVIAAILYTLFSGPSLSVLQDGAYVTTLQAIGLTYADPADAAARVVEQFAYADYDMGTLLTLAAPGVAYPAAVVRLLTEPFGRLFDTRLLACVYALVIGLGAALLVSGLYRHSTLAAVASGAGLAMLCTCTPVMCYLNSLDALGAVIASSVLFLGTLAYCLCREKGCGWRPVAGVMLATVLLLRAQDEMIVLLPFALIAVGLCLWHALPERGRRGLFLLICVLVLLWCGQGVMAGFLGSEEIHADAASYLAVFQGYLPVSDDVEGDLAALGLPAAMAADVGRSYYDPEDSFAYNPRNGGAGEALMQHISLTDRAAFCLTHPERVKQMADAVHMHFYDGYNDRMTTADGQSRYVRPTPLTLIDLLLPVAGSGALTGWMLAAAALCLLCVFIAPRGTGLGKLMVSLALLMLGLACYLPACLVMHGMSDIAMVKVAVFFFGWLGLFVTAAAALCLGNRVLCYLSEKGAPLRRSGAMTPAGRLDKSGWTISRNGLICTCLAVCVLLGVWLLGTESHIGGVNNGDFGRMMEQIDLYWTEDMVYDLDAQLGTQVTEDYSYREPFHPERLTPADPTYSLLFPSMLVRLWSLLTGNPFSTQVLAIILFALTALSILSILRDLHPLLGNVSILLASGLIAMLLGENYVAWYNSLYGESMLSVGLVMTLACAVHLTMMPKGGKGSWRWLILLAVSIRMMSCSKAQMALALPGGLILLAVYSVRHHPQGMKKLIAFVSSMVLCAGLLCWDTLGIYRKNDAISARQTVWQSVFYGALMIADDPGAVMEELGIAPEMKADIGKHAYYADADYVYAPLSEEADAAFYDHVNTMTMVGYYLRHPLDLLKMLDRAAQESVTLHTGFMAYTDESYAEHVTLQRFTAWMNLRPVTACRAFWQYVLLYGAALICCVRILWHKGKDEKTVRTKLFALLFLCIMCIGVFQYPLTVVGNGFADNNKQLYCFMLCHDLLVIFALTAAICLLRRKPAAADVSAPATENRTDEGGMHDAT